MGLLYPSFLRGHTRPTPSRLSRAPQPLLPTPRQPLTRTTGRIVRAPISKASPTMRSEILDRDRKRCRIGEATLASHRDLFAGPPRHGVSLPLNTKDFWTLVGSITCVWRGIIQGSLGSISLFRPSGKPSEMSWTMISIGSDESTVSESSNPF